MNQDNTIDYFLKTCWQNLANTYNHIAAEFGFTQAAGYILINIHREGTTVSQIANSTGVKTTSLSRVLNNLESHGFIYRETSANDKRSVKVYLTELGIEKRQLAKTVVKEFNDYLDTMLTNKERSQLIKTLIKINTLTTEYRPKINDINNIEPSS